MHARHILPLLGVAVLVSGCPPKRITVPAPTSNTLPKVTMDVVFPTGPARTVTATQTDPAMPVELDGMEELSFSAKCSDDTAGCRNIQIFVEGAVAAPNGATTPLPPPSLRAENLDAAAVPGASADTQRNVTAKVDVRQLRGSAAFLKLEVLARATNGIGATADTRRVWLVWVRNAPLVMPNCPRFGPIGSDPPDLLDVRPLIFGLYKAKTANPSKTTFEFGVITNPTYRGYAAFQVSVSESSTLPPTSASFTLTDQTGHAKSALTVDGTNCNAAGQLLDAPGNTTSSTVTATSADTTSLVFTSNNQDVVIWSEPTFWLLFGGKATTFTWLK